MVTSLPASARSAELLWLKERALPGRWIDGGSTYRGWSRGGHGQDPAAEALRELFGELLTDEQALRRLGALIAGTSIRYPMPGPSQHALAGTFVSDLTLHTGQGTTSVAELIHAARPVLLDLADRPDIREAARDWKPRIDICTAQAERG